jgi:hypothetical protein
MSISAKGMSITGIEDRRYWTWVPTEESRFLSNLVYLFILTSSTSTSLSSATFIHA